MEAAKLEKVKKYPFYVEYEKDRDYAKFLEALRNFRNNPDLGLTDPEMREIEEYCSKRDKLVADIKKKAQDFSEGLSEGSVEEVFSAVDAILDDLSSICVFEKAFRPEVYAGLLKKCSQVFKTLESTGYPAEQLSLLKKKLASCS